MNDPFVSYDTFSVGAEFDAPQESSAAATPKDVPLLARLQRLSAPQEKTTKRFDEAETILTGAHVGDAVAGFDAGPLATEGPRPSIVGSPTATIRIDTVTPTAYDDLDAPPQASPVAQHESIEPAAPRAETGDEALEDPWAAWLLNLESAVLPYSRVIVLAAVIAALGLTLVLLQGGAAQTNTSEGAPQVQVETGDAVLATSEEEAPLFWSGETVASQPTTPILDDGLRPLDTPAPAALASGPASAARGTGQARLTGEVRPVTPARVNVAGAAGQPNFPRTK